MCFMLLFSNHDTNKGSYENTSAPHLINLVPC